MKAQWAFKAKGIGICLLTLILDQKIFVPNLTISKYMKQLFLNRETSYVNVLELL